MRIPRNESSRIKPWSVPIICKEAGTTVVAALNDMLRQSLVKARAAWHGCQSKSSATQKKNGYSDPEDSDSPHVSTRQYARIVHQWVSAIGLDSTVYGTHTMRRTKATLIYKRTKNLRAVQLLLEHTKLESTVRYLGIEVDDALEISEQTEI